MFSIRLHQLPLSCKDPWSISPYASNSVYSLQGSTHMDYKEITLHHILHWLPPAYLGSRGVWGPHRATWDDCQLQDTDKQKKSPTKDKVKTEIHLTGQLWALTGNRRIWWNARRTCKLHAHTVHWQDSNPAPHCALAPLLAFMPG